MTMTENPLLKHMRAQNAALRKEIVQEIADLPQCDLRGVLRMIEQWKGRAALNTGKADT
jgi:quinol monooxygenase YgiN